ncbi:MAG: Cyclopropane-fatty-acyl-phospholipid synthase [Hyphomicrobiales bacterium]|nr:Cyclopropane-fatty-acyl-phospholipid synthase [Hyphomicrobiales bacterium]
MSERSKGFILNLLKGADIIVGGNRPWDIQIHDDRLYDRVMTQGTLGFGEGYMDGWWDSGAIDQLIHRLLKFDVKSHIRFDMALVASTVKGRLLNLQRLKVYEVGEKHYDIGNDLYSAMLDKRMIYSCGYWKDATDLDAAQEAKLDLICRKVGLQPGMRILDIGSGWGGFLKFAAERYGVEGVGVTISKEQAAFANANRGDLPIETRLVDYMSLDGKFDRIISIGMFEHVGYKNYRRYMEKAHSLLADDGLFLLHTIGGNLTQTNGEPWSEKYIFPNGMLPSIKQMGAAVEGLFVTEDWHNFGDYYDRTLLAWLDNFENAWPDLRDKYDERFHRMWQYYLCSFAAAFRMRHMQLWQIVLSPNGVEGGYNSIR